MQADFKPKICNIAAGLLFPSSVNNLGSHGNGMSPLSSLASGVAAMERFDDVKCQFGSRL